MSLKICDFCHRLQFGVTERSVDTSPSEITNYQICHRCFAEGYLPQSFSKRWGISHLLTPLSKFVRFVGDPQVTESEFGLNAYGSVLAEYDDGSLLGVTCGHGGSAWLCLCCAQRLEVKNVNREKLANIG